MANFVKRGRVGYRPSARERERGESENAYRPHLDALAVRGSAFLGCWLCALAALLVAMCALATPAFADAEHSKVAPKSASAQAKILMLEGMVPIAGNDVNDGTYEIAAESSSPFFKIQSAELTAKGGQMTAALHIDSKSYPLIYMGTAEQAAAAAASDYIAFDDESWTFTIPVSALDAEIDCAAYSKRRKMWYDRKLVLYAATLPEGALSVELPAYGAPLDADGGTVAKTASDIAAKADAAGSHSSTGASDSGANASGSSEASSPAAAEPSAASSASTASLSSDAPAATSGAVAVDRPDGEYSIEVNMTGGSGRASVSSPTWLIVKDGRAYARLLWSSSYYDYMIVDEQRYDNETDDGSNSTFTIPITAMDEEIDVVADTTAMGDPVEIEYHLTFYSSTIDVKDAIPQEAAIKVLYIAIAIIAIGGVLNHVLKKRRKR